MIGSVDFDSGNEDAIASEFAHLFAEVLFALLIKLLQSELKNLLLFQYFYMQVNHPVYTLDSAFNLL